MTLRLAITFDFHDTLASCDTWFGLEVRTLPVAVIGRLPASALSGGPVPEPDIITSTYRALRAEIIEHGNELDAGSGVAETFRRLNLRADHSAVAATIDVVMREALGDVRAKPGAVETVVELHRRGFLLGVVSSAVHHPFLLWALEQFSILPMFETVVTSASSGYYKSRPEIYRRALDELGVGAGATCHVGDSSRWDHQMAKSLGMRTVLVSHDPPCLDEGHPGPDLHLPSLVDAADAIASVAGRHLAAESVR